MAGLEIRIEKWGDGTVCLLCCQLAILVLLFRDIGLEVRGFGVGERLELARALATARYNTTRRHQCCFTKALTELFKEIRSFLHAWTCLANSSDSMDPAFRIAQG